MLFIILSLMFSVLNLFIFLSILSYVAYSLGVPEELAFAVSTIFYFSLRIISTFIQTIFMPEEPERNLFEMFIMIYVILKDKMLDMFPRFHSYDANVVV